MAAPHPATGVILRQLWPAAGTKGIKKKRGWLKNTTPIIKNTSYTFFENLGSHKN